MTRALFNVTWTVLAFWLPVPIYGLRRALLRAFGATIDPTARIYHRVTIWFPKNLTMQAQSCLGPGAICYCMDRITLGPYALVSQRAHLCAGTHEIDDPAFPLVTRPIAIEASAWVAAEAFVGPGVVVGEGAVLGARAVAFKNLDPWTVYAGNPAKPLRARRRPDKPA